MTNHAIDSEATPPPVVRRADRDDALALAGIVADALWDDPPFVWAFPDPDRRREILPRFFGLIVDASIDAGAGYTVDDLSAACLWFPPGGKMSDEEGEAFEQAVLEIAGEYSESGPFEIMRALDEVHPADPHWYLAFVCTRKGMRGQGIGTTLIRDGLQRCDEDGHPAYLEMSTNERNRHLYERLGFRVTNEIELRGGPKLWTMWRDPAVATQG